MCWLFLSFRRQRKLSTLIASRCSLNGFSYFSSLLPLFYRLRCSVKAQYFIHGGGGSRNRQNLVLWPYRWIIGWHITAFFIVRLILGAVNICDLLHFVECLVSWLALFNSTTTDMVTEFGRPLWYFFLHCFIFVNILLL